MLEFDWDTGNVGHIAAHNDTPFEVEEVFSRKRIVLPVYTRNGEERRNAHGKTSAGRYLTVTFTVRGHLLRPITAHDMKRKDRRDYATQIDEEI